MNYTLVNDVFEILLQQGINPGFAMRFSSCCKSLNNILKNHDYYWKYVSLDLLKWKKEKENFKVIESIKNGRKCRECASSLCYKVLTTQNSFVWLCVNCIKEEKGFSELYSRRQIFGGKDLWSNKRRIVNYLTMATKGIAGKHLYWSHEVKKYRIQAVLKNKRILPF
jgi:hypothetical protein